MTRDIHSYNPLRKVFSFLSIIAALFVIALAVVFFQWVITHVFTLLWIVALIACCVWLFYSVTAPGTDHYDDDQEPITEKFQG